MPSPFPGMNPYLEQTDVWPDFHDRLIPSIGEALSPQVSPHFFVKIEQDLYIHEPSAEERIRIGRADIAVNRTTADRAGDGGGSRATLPAPREIFIAAEVDVVSLSFIEIRDRVSREVVTVIEVLSPTNKRPGADREQYLAKRRGVLHSPAHFVEIDLLRGWPKMPDRETPPCDYGVLVSVYEDRPRAGFWPIALRDRLPTIPVPIREPVPRVWLDLQSVLHTVYDRAYYKDYIYRGVPEPSLSAEDRAWAESLANTGSD